MTYLSHQKEEYRIPLVELCDAQPDILCQSPTDPDDWGNEGLTPGDSWN
ncbi:MAG: hypothetical protein J5759_04255 [Bacteroidales bacterium]|nr:hypothetical protein [Bacteroidales bacterium]